MKGFLTTTLLLAGLCSTVQAIRVNGADIVFPNFDPPPPIQIVVASSSIPVPVSSLSDGMHFLDNVIPGGCRDVIHGTWMGCTGEALYKKDYLSLDAIYAVPIEGNGFFAPGIRVYVGQLLLEQVPAVKALATNNLVLTSALNYLSGGGFYTRDLNQGLDRAGYYLGLLAKFGP